MFVQNFIKRSAVVHELDRLTGKKTNKQWWCWKQYCRHYHGL